MDRPNWTLLPADLWQYISSFLTLEELNKVKRFHPRWLLSFRMRMCNPNELSIYLRTSGKYRRSLCTYILDNLNLTGLESKLAEELITITNTPGNHLRLLLMIRVNLNLNDNLKTLYHKIDLKSLRSAKHCQSMWHESPVNQFYIIMIELLAECYGLVERDYSLIGDIGPTGPTGPAGYQGIQGPTGAVGPTGW